MEKSQLHIANLTPPLTYHLGFDTVISRLGQGTTVMLQQSQFSRERDITATVQQRRDTLSRINRELYNDMILEQVQSSNQVIVPAKAEFQSGQGSYEGRVPSKSSCIVERIELANIRYLDSQGGRIPARGKVPIGAKFQTRVEFQSEQSSSE